MDRRLPQRDGEWIDRNEPIDFRFEGETFSGLRGDVLSSALWANDVRMLGRSFKYHRPRGIYSLANHDANVMVADAVGRTNLRGDSLAIEPEMDLRAVNTFGSLKRDWMRITEKFSRFLPVGFYYKAFHTQRFLFRFYENQMRKVAGLGSIDPAAEAQSTPKDYAHCDLLVVGAGPAGLSAAVAAGECGVEVLLVDEQPHLGGSLNWQTAGEEQARQQRQRLITQLKQLDNVTIRCATEVGGWYSDHWIALVDQHRLTKLRTKTIVCATGCIEQPAVFGHNDLPGVMLASAAQRLIHLYAVKPFDRCVVLAANDDAYRAAIELHEVGVEIPAVIDLRIDVDSTPATQRVNDAGITVLHGRCVYEAVPAKGKTRIDGAIVCPIDASGQADTSTQTRFDCDGVIMSVGWMPAAGLVCQAGGRYTYADHVEQFVPQTLPEDLFVAGRANGIFDLEQQWTDGRRAGLEAAVRLGKFDGDRLKIVTHTAAPPSHPYPIIPHKKQKNFVELDEDLHLADFTNAHQEGYDNIELIKRYTTVGMGPTQGKLANMNAVRILARLNSQSIDQTGSTTSRPFHQPVSLAHLAGRRFHPTRRTPMHDWHARAGAHFIYAGDWLRPEYYKADDISRRDRILDEAKRVRESVGMIDVGTLGKLEISGPDAASFLERIYTGRFAKQPVGRVRYVLACDETGVIIDDGIAAHMAENRFYVTATTTGAAALYHEMQRWAILWQMHVTLSNVTGHLAAMNIAGPRSRDVLAAVTDIDLAADSFAYLGFRLGQVAGVPARAMRVGFVGELGYEIHVSASAGLHVWQALMQAGEPHDIAPFGVEAQRLLRLEKGHLIVSQDTDALTNPYEAGAAWTIGKNKSFFIGQRSLDIVKRQELTRRLVGIRFKENHREPLPDESHLIIHGGEIAGRLTSVIHHSTLGYPLALAYMWPDLCAPGTKVSIRLDGGAMVQAEVTSIPFYDQENARQS